MATFLLVMLLLYNFPHGSQNFKEIWKNDEKRHLTKSSYSLQMKLKTGLSLKNTNFSKNVFLRLTEMHLQN